MLKMSKKLQKRCTEEQLYECNPGCNSPGHIRDLIAAVTRDELTDAEVGSYLKRTSYCFSNNSDIYGRTILHIAASCGRTALCDWLIRCSADINCSDLESGYTALHRCLLSGNVDTAVSLIKHGASISGFDNEGFSPLAIFKRCCCLNLKMSSQSTKHYLYTWGTNSNYNIGFATEHGKSTPELMEYFCKRQIDIKQVCLHTFHTLFLTKEGEVYSCGLGSGGRLGLGNVDTVIVPRRISFSEVGPGTCIQAAVGRDHSVFLFEPSKIMVCGLNTFGQLDVISNSSKCINEPVIVPLPKGLRGKINGICASTYHTAFWTQYRVYVFGYNGGQFGFKTNSEHEIKLIPLISETERIQGVAVSDGSTVVWTSKNVLHVYCNYNHEIVSMPYLFQFDNSVLNVKLYVYGGILDTVSESKVADAEKFGVNKRTTVGEKLILFVIAKNRLWKLLHKNKEQYCLLRCYTGNHVVKDIAINKKNVLLITGRNTYVGKFEYHKIADQNKSRQLKDDVYEEHSESDEWYYVERKSKLRKYMIDDDEYYTVTFEHRIPFLTQNRRIFSDNEGDNFAAIQEFKVPAKMIPAKMYTEEETEFIKRIEMGLNDFHDVIYEIDSIRFPASRYIVSCASEFLGQLPICESSNTVKIRGIHPEIFQLFLKFTYDGSDWNFIKRLSKIKIPLTYEKKPFGYFSTINGVDEFISQNIQSLNLFENEDEYRLRMAYLMAKDLGFNELYTTLQQTWPPYQSSSRRYFKKEQYPSLCDVTVECSDSKTFFAHKCILGTYDYFYPILSGRWHSETENAHFRMKIPFNSDVVNDVLNFCYDPDSILDGAKRSFNFWCSMLVAADELLLNRLKLIAEKNLVNHLDIRTVLGIYQYAEMYRASCLSNTCLCMINLNISLFLESRVLEDLEPELLKKINVSFKDYIRCCTKVDLNMPKYSNAPDINYIKEIHKKYPVQIEEIDNYEMVFNIAQTLSKNSAYELMEKKKKNKHSSKRKRGFEKSQEANLKNENINNILNESLELELPNLSSVDEEKWIDIEKHSRLKNRLKAINAAYNSPEILEYDDEFTNLTASTRFTDSGLESAAATPSTDKLNQYRSPVESLTISLDMMNIISCKMPQKQMKKMRKAKKNSCSSSSDVDSPTPKISSSPWNISNSPENKSISEIIASEINQKKITHTIVRNVTMKSLEQMQIEDQAIEELINFYNAKQVDDENITVQRVRQTLEVPKWIDRKKRK